MTAKTMTSLTLMWTDLYWFMITSLMHFNDLTKLLTLKWWDKDSLNTSFNEFVELTVTLMMLNLLICNKLRILCI